jgi:hypothetical protein
MLVYVWSTAPDTWWWSGAGMRELWRGFYSREKIAKGAARQAIAARWPGKEIEFIVDRGQA